MAKLSHLEKEYIKANYKNKSIDELAKKLEKDRELIEEYINNLQSNKKSNTKVNKNEKANSRNKSRGNIISKLFSKKDNQEPIFKRYEIKPYHLSKIDAVFAAVFLLASVVCAYIAIDICIKRKCQTLEFKYKVRNKRKGNSINQLITALNSLCAENNIHIYSESLHSLPDNKTDGRILCIIQLVFYILLDYAIKAGRQPLRLLFFIKQEENDFVIISVSLIGSAISRRRNKTASLQCSLHEILLNHLVRICHGRVQYLDSQASAKNIRIIVPVSQYFDTGA